MSKAFQLETLETIRLSTSNLVNSLCFASALFDEILLKVERIDRGRQLKYGLSFFRHRRRYRWAFARPFVAHAEACELQQGSVSGQTPFTQNPGDLSGRPQAAAPPRELVPYGGRYAPGTIVISTEERRLYYFLPGAKALRYGVGVGGPGFT